MPGEMVVQTTETRAAPRARDLEQEFAALLETHRERALRLAWRLVGGDDAAAQDVTQEAFIRAWHGLGRFRGDAKLSTWLYRIVVRQAANHRRWRGVRERWGGLYPEEAPDPRPRPHGDPGLRRRIATALGSLSRGQREAFVLVHLEGFTVNEAAEVLGKAPGTIKSHLHRALAKLRLELGDLRGDAAGGEDDASA